VRRFLNGRVLREDDLAHGVEFMSDGLVEVGDSVAARSAELVDDALQLKIQGCADGLACGADPAVRLQLSLGDAAALLCGTTCRFPPRCDSRSPWARRQ